MSIIKNKIEKFNNKFKIGEHIIYVDDFGDLHFGIIGNAAWELCGTAVVSL